METMPTTHATTHPSSGPVAPHRPLPSARAADRAGDLFVAVIATMIGALVALAVYAVALGGGLW